MKLPHYEEHLLDSAWQDLEFEFKSAGMVGPEPGFTNRWQQRLAKQQEAAGRRQAWFVFAANVVIAFGFLSLMGLRSFSALPAPNQLFTIWVELFARIVVFFNMILGLLETLARTLPAVVPTRWWVNVAGSFGVLILMWISLMRQHAQEQGANV